MMDNRWGCSPVGSIERSKSGMGATYLHNDGKSTFVPSIDKAKVRLAELLDTRIA